jgi:hypothetical protein
MEDFNVLADIERANKIIEHWIFCKGNIDYPVFPDTINNVIRILKGYKRIYKLPCSITKVGKLTISFKQL